MKLQALYRAVGAISVRRPWTILGLAALACAASAWLAATRLTLKTSNLDLIDPELPPVRNFTRFAEEFGTPNVLVVVLEGGDPAHLAEAADALAAPLREIPGVRSVVARLPIDDATAARLGADPHIASRDRGLFFIFVQPEDIHSRAETIAPLVEGVRRVIEGADLRAPGIRAGLTGIPEYAINDRDVIQHDISSLSVVSFALVLLLFVYAFGTFRRPVMSMVALGVGVMLTLGAIAIHPGHLTLLSAFFASILFGLGIDYGIHLINRVEEYVAGGMPEGEAIPAALGQLAPELTTSALTTAGVFYAMRFCGFRGFEELGVIAGTGILLCLLTTMTVLPALLTVVPHRAHRDRRPAERRIGSVLCALQHRGLAAALAFAALGSIFVKGPGFDANYLHLQPADSEAARLETEMVERSDYSPQFAVFITGSREEAAALSDRLLDDETVAEVRSISDLDALSAGLGSGLAWPPDFLGGFQSTGGRYAVYAYPAGNVWDPAEQTRFIEHMQALDPRVTGMPILGQFMVERSQRALRITTLLGAIILAVCVLADFRNPWLALLAALPTVLTVESMHALMRLLEIPFNPLNVMALPVVLGIAVDDGVHIVHRFVAEKGDLARTLAGSGRSVVLTSATTLAAFGSLAFTSHRGLASFANALSLGVAVALLLSVVVLPAALALLRRRLPVAA